MVSHIEHPDQLVPQRPQAISSRHSLSRKHQSLRRSSNAASESPAANEFPVFSQTGDVDITITSPDGRQEQRYLLHRLILTQCSGFFDSDIQYDESAVAPVTEAPYVSLLRRNETAALSRSAEPTSSIHSRACSVPRPSSCFLDRECWHYSLDWPSGPSTRPPMLSQRETWPCARRTSGPPPPVSRNKARPLSSFPYGVVNFSAVDAIPPSPVSSSPCTEICRDYDNLFRIFYNYPPELDTTNLTLAYKHCKTLLHLADAYDALEVVGPRIDHHLLQFQSRLFQHIAKYAPSYLKLAFLARSKVIFAEALVHIVGQWPLAAPQLRDQIDVSVIHLIEDKVDDLVDLKCRIDAKLFRLTLTTSTGERVTPANSYLDWMAVSLFRQWMSEFSTPASTLALTHMSSLRTTTHDSHSHSQRRSKRSSSRSLDHCTSQAHHSVSSASLTQSKTAAQNSDRIYHILSSPRTSAYLPRDDLKRFLKLTPGLYSRENVARFEGRMNELKAMAREVVGPLVRCSLQLDGGVGDGGMRGRGEGGVGDGVAGFGYLTCTRVSEEDYPWDNM